MNFVVLAMVTAAVVGVQAVDRPAVSLEGSVRRYAAAVSNQDLEGAMAEIAPDQRARWTSWVQEQLGNVYEVRGIAVRSSGLLAPPLDVTSVLDVNHPFQD